MKKFFIIFLLIGLFSLVVGVFYFQPKEIKIGLLVQLSGPGSELGVHTRNGARLAVQEINHQGGIKGKKIILLEEDTIGSPFLVKQKFLKLINQKVKAIIGPITSSMALKIVPLANQYKVVLLSPTVSTPLLNKKKDYFFRLETSSDEEAKYLANFTYIDLQIKKVGIVWDLNNEGYTRPYLETFTNQFQHLGGKIIFTKAYANQKQLAQIALNDFTQLTAKDGLLFISKDEDLLKGVEYLISPSPILLSSSWAMTQNLKVNYPLLYRKKIFFASTTKFEPTPAQKQFDLIYQKHYGFLPSCSAYRGYDALKVLAFALSKEGDLRKNLLSLKNFPGIQFPITFTPYGDIKLTFCIYSLQNEDFFLVKKCQ